MQSRSLIGPGGDNGRRHRHHVAADPADFQIDVGIARTLGPALDHKHGAAAGIVNQGVVIGMGVAAEHHIDLAIQSLNYRDDITDQRAGSIRGFGCCLLISALMDHDDDGVDSLGLELRT